jgi:hypothetical protein
MLLDIELQEYLTGYARSEKAPTDTPEPEAPPEPVGDPGYADDLDNLPF